MKTLADDNDLKLLDQWIKEVYGLSKLIIARNSGRHKGPIPRPTSTPTAVAILNRDDAGAIAMVRAYIVKLQEHARERESHEFMHQLSQRLLKRPLPFSEDDLIWLARQTAAASDFWEWPVVEFVDALERHVQRHGLSSELEQAAGRMLKKVEQAAWHKTTRSAVPRLKKLTLGAAETFSVDQGEPWVKRLYADWQRMKGLQRAGWNSLLCHAQQTTASKPSPEWLETARRLVHRLGADEFVARLAEWFPLVARGRTDKPPKELGLSKPEASCWSSQMSIVNTLLLKGLIWCCRAVPDRRNRPVLESLMAECYRETPLGKRFAVGGTACKRALEAMA